MDIGEEQRTIHIEPVKSPVPPRRAPVRPQPSEPAERPAVAPERRREKVPA